ncbi:MAG TPA: DUF5682 family protein [Verrucomicrobiae bacterium]|nr:DUF5682 family protein [Verrucomicrobiae bacterium]
MEGLLRSPQVAEIDRLYQKAFNLAQPVIYFPVRHHSPACSFQLSRLIKEYNPDTILIEGPSDANHLISFLGHGDSEYPLCIYYSFNDRKGLLGEDNGKYACYYPFLDYSPELVGIQAALDKGIPVQFIDLPYPEILLATKQGEGLRDESGKHSYNDDYLLARSKFIQALCEREGCRNFAELWEKLYEIDGLRLPTGDFVRNMLGFCYLARCDYTEEMLVESLARERFMAARIREEAGKYGRVLVITGGFHTWGLVELAEQQFDIKLNSINPGDTGAYLMGYSFAESDQLSGYASGMPHPAFYQRVWQNICQGEDNPYEQAVLHFIVRCGSQIRKNDGVLSTADEIEAYNHAKGLKTLRDKYECGVYELRDGVQTAFVKGELTVSTEGPLVVLEKLLRGRKNGSVCGEADIPPVVKDFREQAKKYKLKINTTAEQEVVLDVYRSKRHRELSRFLYTMHFLATGFSAKVKGPDFTNRTHLNLVRETWKYHWHTAVESRLVELSVYGGSLKEVARQVLAQKLADCGSHAGEASLLLIDAYMMGLEEQLAEILAHVEEVIHKDGSFYSGAQCLYNLGFLLRSQNLLASANNRELNRIVGLAYYKTVYLIPSLHNTGEGDENTVVGSIKDVYYLTLQRELDLDPENFADALAVLTNHPDCNPCLEGASAGILLGLNKISRASAVQKAQGYLQGSGDKFLASARFLKGLFATARDIILVEGSLVAGMDNVLKNLDETDFLKLLPDLRLAFSYFNPAEIDTIGTKVAGLYGLTGAKILRVEGVDPKELADALDLDGYARGKLLEWGILHGT